MSEKLPPDPDGQNGDRCRWALAGITAFRMQTQTEQEDACSDLLADLMHWCDRNDTTFEHELRRAKAHYWAETQTEGGF
jgi:hypothetical protein